MTDEKDLRDRISTVMWSAIISDGRRAAMVPDCKAMAQAIIDEFGLTVEKSMVSHEVHDDGSWTTWPSQTRVVGKWVKQ